MVFDCVLSVCNVHGGGGGGVGGGACMHHFGNLLTIFFEHVVHCFFKESLLRIT
jgi:hypothetical protein